MSTLSFNRQNFTVESSVKHGFSLRSGGAKDEFAPPRITYVIVRVAHSQRPVYAIGQWRMYKLILLWANTILFNIGPHFVIEKFRLQL